MSRRPGRLARLVIGGCALAGILAMPARADAHALATSSDPAAGATLARSPAQVVITFSEQPDPALSAIKVLDTTGRQRAGGPAQPVPGQANTLRIAVPDLPNGVYTVTWHTVSKVDGHLAAGSFSFGIGVSAGAVTAPKASVVTSPRPSTLAVVARWLYLGGLIGLLGLAFDELFVLSGATLASTRLLDRGLLVAWLCAMLGALGITEGQREAANVAVSKVFSSSLGHSLLVRGLPLLVTGTVLALVLLPKLRRPASRARRAVVAVLALATLGAMLADVTTSHAASSHGWIWFRSGTQWLHFAFAGIWVGGLAGLLLCLASISNQARRAVALRYSAFALLSVAAVAVTGSLRALDEIESWHQLFTTGFGQLVIVKSVLLVVLIGFGAVNRYRSLPSMEGEGAHSERGLLRVGGVELVVMAVVLLATAVLVNLAPPRSTVVAKSKALPPLVVDTHDFATTVRLGLTVTPGSAGFNQFRLAVTDYDTGRPVVADHVSLQFHFPDRTDVGDSNLNLTPSSDGTYAASGGNLSLQGRWEITALVQSATSSVQVAMDVVPQFSPQPTDVQHNSGLPTFYFVHLSGGRQLQIYLDPGHPGLNQFHATFLEANGTESNITTFYVTSTLEPGGSASLLTTRKLDTLGHYVADAPVVRGTYRFTVSATTAAGDPLGATIEIPVR